MEWLTLHEFSCHVVESKAVYSFKAGRYLRGMADAGMPDIIGCDSDGEAVFIEVKAPGKRTSLRPAQRAFLLEKIERGAFAVCVDDLDQLADLYLKWRRESRPNRRVLLKNALPPERRSRKKQTPSDLPF